MSIWQAIILGVVQGITEFLPVSSSGHLIALPTLFGWDVQGYDFDVIVHMATLLAILVAMWGDVKRLFEKIVFGKVVLATIPVVLVGLVISFVALDFIRQPAVVAANLFLWGIVLWVADRYSLKFKKPIEKLKNIGWGKALLVGIAQALAIIPGTSRSGVTITAGLFSGMSREMATRFSFLLAIPAIAGAGIFAGMDILEHSASTSVGALVAGFIAAFLAGLISIRFLLNFVKKSSFVPFAIYRIVLAAILVIWII
jgi:undecaprenyl-diphosphatase